MNSISSVLALSRHLKLRHLYLFRSVCELGTLRRASAALSIAQPAATKLIQELEEALGVPLFVRNRRGMTLTPYGELVRRHVGVLFADIGTMRDEVEALSHGQTGLLRLGVIPSLNAQLLAKSIHQAIARWPAIRITVQEGVTTELVAALARNELDVTYGRILTVAQAGSMCAVPVYTESFSIVCSARNALARRRFVTWRELVESNWALPVEGTPLRQLIDGIFARNGVLRPRAQVECSGYEQIRQVVAHSSLVGVLPRALAFQASARRDLALLRSRLEGDFVPISLMYRKGIEPSPLATAYVEMAMALAQSMRLPMRDVPRSKTSPG